MTSRLLCEKSPAAEALRLTLLTLAALWLASPLLSDRLIGTGDAQWYANMMADAVTQARAGVWPVWIGQSDFAFNGVVYPHRAAPYYHHLGILLDTLTLRSLGVFALQHLTVVVSLLGGALSCYLCLAALAPARRWAAFFLALLYVTCPGVAGLVYAQDLYMSAMTLPWVPLAFYGAARSLEERGGDFPALVPLCAGLAALWWAHSPVALWATLLCGALQLVRLRTLTLKNALLAAALFLALAAYPLASVLKLHAPGAALVPYAFDRTKILDGLRAAFPATLLPLGRGPTPLTDLQLGWALWLVLAAALLGALRLRHRPALALLACAAALLFLLFPLPGNSFVWLHLPETLVSITFYWPAQRFYLLVAALGVFAAQLVLRSLPCDCGRRRRVALILAALPLCWSFAEAEKLLARARATPAPAADVLRPENHNLMRHSYGLYPAMPSYFTYGNMDPAMESRLLDATGARLLATNFDLPPAASLADEFSVAPDSANPGILNLSPALTLDPGARHLLTLAFTRPDARGVLQILGPHFFREYALPTAEAARGFGSGPLNRPSLTLWTTHAEPETVRLRFIPADADPAGTAAITAFARYRFAPLDPARLPVQLHTLVPRYAATVRATAPGWLETPRMFLPGYTATVSGRPVAVKKSPAGLAMLPVPAGESRVELAYAPPAPVRAAFWFSAVAWVALLGFTFARRLRPARAA